MKQITNNNVIKRINKTCNAMIVVSILTIISSIATAIGLKIWLDNFTVTQFTSEAQQTAYSIGAYMGAIGGIITITLAIVSISLLISLLIYRAKFKKQTKNTSIYQIKTAISIFLFFISLAPLVIILLVGLFRSL